VAGLVKGADWRDWAALSEGCYILRSNVTDWKDQDLWEAYIQLTEAEGAFRIHKSDLSLRPVWHQKPDRVQAHILVCFLAYVLWKTLAQLCRQAGLGDEPRKVLDETGANPGNRRDGPDLPCRWIRWSAAAQAMYQSAHRPPGHPSAPPWPPPAVKDEDNRPAGWVFTADVVKTSRVHPLSIKYLRR